MFDKKKKLKKLISYIENYYTNTSGLNSMDVRPVEGVRRMYELKDYDNETFLMIIYNNMFGYVSLTYDNGIVSTNDVNFKSKDFEQLKYSSLTTAIKAYNDKTNETLPY